MTGDDDVRGKETVVLDDRIVTDVVAAPQSHVVADPNAGLKSVVLQDEAVVADRVIGRGARTSVPEMEAQVRALGRAYGAHTAGPGS